METSTKRPPEAWMDKSLFESGIGHVVIARFKASGETEAGVFLIDIRCLGVKNAFFTRLPFQEYQDRLLARIFSKPEDRESITPACGRKLVEDAIAYARGFGMEPHPDCRQAQRVFGGIDPAECDRQFTFGDDGKPLYIQGPHDSDEFAALVLAQLERRCGKDGFHYIIEVKDGHRE
jgi:hypothetical protein